MNGAQSPLAMTNATKIPQMEAPEVKKPLCRLPS